MTGWRINIWDADSLSDGELLYAQDHLRHLSALYGALRPLDGIRPYRLEMGRRPRGLNLYKFWAASCATTCMPTPISSSICVQ